MTRASVTDEKLTALLAGRPPADGDDLASELAWMIEQVDSAFPLPVVSEQVEDTHLARMMEVSGELPVPVTAPLAPVHSSLFDRLRAGLARKVAAATLASTAAFGGAAYAGVLPAPVQEAVSNAAALVGLELPNPADDDEDQDVRQLEEVGDDYQPPNDAEGSGPDGPRSGDGTGSDGDGLGSERDDSDPEGDDDGHAGDGADSDGDADQDDGDEPDGGDEPDSDEPDGGDEPDSDEPDGGDDPDSDEPDGGDSSGTEDRDLDSEDELAGTAESGFDLDDEGAFDL